MEHLPSLTEFTQDALKKKKLPQIIDNLWSKEHEGVRKHYKKLVTKKLPAKKNMM